MKNDRLLAMVDVFLHEGRKTAEELASRFEVSVRTVYRDVDALCAAGVPIVSYLGAVGGYELEESYRIDRGFLSGDEISDLTGLLKGFSEAVKDRNLERSLGKIASLGRRTDKVHAPDVLPPPLIATLSPWGAQGPEPSVVSEFRRAVSARRVVSFRYADGEGRETERSVEPYSLVITVAVWYLHGWCRLRGAFRLFKLSRISGPIVVLEPFDPYARIPVPSPFSGGSEPLEDIVLSAENRLASLVAETFPSAEEEPGCGGYYRVFRFRYPLGPWFVRMLLYFGPGLKILAPESLRAEYAAAASEMAAENRKE